MAKDKIGKFKLHPGKGKKDRKNYDACETSKGAYARMMISRPNG